MRDLQFKDLQFKDLQIVIPKPCADSHPASIKLEYQKPLLPSHREIASTDKNLEKNPTKQIDQGVLETLLSTFEPIKLPEMARVALLDRIETKYLMHINSLVQVLGKLDAAYSVLTIEDRRLNRYRTLYFDTGDFALYHRHHMGARNRYKIRAREYVESHSTFLEVKHKTNKRRTIKHRILTPELVTGFEGNSAQFVRDTVPYDIQELVPRLWNYYTRITLVNKARNERVTLDFDLRFGWNEQQTELSGLVIAEVKQQGRAHTSEFTTLMREQRIRSTSFSKYCVGVNLLYPEVKQNKFKVTQRLIAKLMRNQIPG